MAKMNREQRRQSEKNRKRYSQGDYDNITRYPTGFIKFMAYYTRYFEFFVTFMISSLALAKYNPTLPLCLMLLINGLHIFLGYKFDWEHIYCAMQDVNHSKLTPYAIPHNRRVYLKENMKKYFVIELSIGITGTLISLIFI